MPVYQSGGFNLGDALQGAVQNALLIRQQKRLADQFDMERADRTRANTIQEAGLAQQGIHLLQPGELPPGDVAQNIVGSVDSNAITRNAQADALQQAMTSPVSRFQQNAKNIPGHPENRTPAASSDPGSNFQTMLASALGGAAQPSQPPRYEFGKGFYIDRQPQFDAANVARSQHIEDQFTPLLVKSMMDQSERQRKISQYTAAGVPADRAALYVDNPSLAENDPKYGKPVTNVMNERVPEKFTFNGQPMQGFADKNGNYYDASGKKLSGAITPFTPPRTQAEADQAKKFGADQTNKILDDYRADTADFRKVMGGWQVLQGAVKDPSLATPFAVTDAYARITNPGAIVRPTTMEMIHDMGSVGQRMAKFWSQNANGSLPPDILRDFQKTLYNIVAEHKQQYDQVRAKTIRRGKDTGVDVSPYLEDYELNDPTKTASPPKSGNINLGDTNVNPFASLIPRKP